MSTGATKVGLTTFLALAATGCVPDVPTGNQSPPGNDAGQLANDVTFPTRESRSTPRRSGPDLSSPAQTEDEGEPASAVPDAPHDRAGSDCPDGPECSEGSTAESGTGVSSPRMPCQDDQCPCEEGTVQACDRDVDPCQQGTRTCTDGGWTECVGAVEPGEEVCDTEGQDEDCDGEVNEGCACEEGEIRVCGTNQAPCKQGIKTCSDGVWPEGQESCVGAVQPRAEVCDAARVDEDCDGVPNDGCVCDEGETRKCGACGKGVRRCVGGAWSADCEGDVGPGESCDTEGDLASCGGRCQPGEECISGGCVCTAASDTNEEHCGRCGNACRLGEECVGGECQLECPEEGRPCEEGVGACQRMGRLMCTASGQVTCSATAAPPRSEECFTRRDEDCDGKTDEIPDGQDCCDDSDCGRNETCRVSLLAGRRTCEENNPCGDGVVDRSPPQQEVCDPGEPGASSLYCDDSCRITDRVYQTCSSGACFPDHVGQNVIGGIFCGQHHRCTYLCKSDYECRTGPLGGARGGRCLTYPEDINPSGGAPRKFCFVPCNGDSCPLGGSCADLTGFGKVCSG